MLLLFYLSLLTVSFMFQHCDIAFTVFPVPGDQLHTLQRQPGSAPSYGATAVTPTQDAATSEQHVPPPTPSEHETRHDEPSIDDPDLDLLHDLQTDKNIIRTKVKLSSTFTQSCSYDKLLYFDKWIASSADAALRERPCSKTSQVLAQEVSSVPLVSVQIG